MLNFLIFIIEIQLYKNVLVLRKYTVKCSGIRRHDIYNLLSNSS